MLDILPLLEKLRGALHKIAVKGLQDVSFRKTLDMLFNDKNTITLMLWSIEHK